MHTEDLSPMSTLSMLARPGVLLDRTGAHPSEAVGILKGGIMESRVVPLCMLGLAVEAAHLGSAFPRGYCRAVI